MKDLSAENALHRQAHRRVALKMGWFIHATVYVVVNLMLIAGAQYSSQPRYVLGPLLGWGLGLAIHGIVVALNLVGGGWRQRLLDRELQRLRS